MTVLPPRIDVTSSRAITLLRSYPEQIVGSLWVAGISMNGSSDVNQSALPKWWIDAAFEKNQAQFLLNNLNALGQASSVAYRSLHWVLCIIVVADRANPGNFFFLIQNLEMRQDGLELLQVMAERNIPACTIEIGFPYIFLEQRYGDSKTVPSRLTDLKCWSVQVWEDYCLWLLSQEGMSMVEEYWSGNLRTT